MATSEKGASPLKSAWVNKPRRTLTNLLYQDRIEETGTEAWVDWLLGAQSTAVNISATRDSLTLTEYPATIGKSLNISATRDQLTLVEYPATVSLSINVLGTTEALTLVERPCTISFGATVTSNAGSISWSPENYKLRKRLKQLALQQAYLEDDEEALAILLATIMREYR